MVSKSNKQLGSILLVILVVVALVWVFMNMKNMNVQNDGNYTHQEQSMDKETLENAQPMPDSNSMMLNAAPAPTSNSNPSN